MTVRQTQCRKKQTSIVRSSKSKKRVKTVAAMAVSEGQTVPPRDLKRASGATKARAAPTANGPTTIAAVITKTFLGGSKDGSGDCGLGIGDLYDDLVKQMERMSSGDLTRAEHMLLGQAHALQAIFLHFTLKGRNQTRIESLQAVMGIGLKAQAQCRATLQTLVDIKYPRQMSFVGQQNNAVNQQVNNGTTEIGTSRARENTVETTNELLEGKKDERLDNSTARQASRTNTPVAAVEPINRSAHRNGKGQGKKKLT